MIRLLSLPFRLLRFALRWARRATILLVVVAMLALNLGTLAFAPLAAAAGSMLARAGITTVADARATQLARSEARLASKTDELASAQRRLATQADELATARGRLARQSDELRHLSRADRTRRQAVATFADNVSRRTATAAARNLAAVPAESLPLLGIAVVLGATAWELSDACALMHDVHELNVAFNPDEANDPDKHEACGLEVPTLAEVRQRLLADPAGAYAAQPQDYDLPAFEKPDWRDWLRFWTDPEPTPAGPAPAQFSP